MEPNDGLFVVIGGDIAPLRSALSDASRLSSSFASNLTRAFTDATLKGRELSDVLKSLALSLSQNTLEAALRPISQALGNSLTQLVGGRCRCRCPLPMAA